MGDIYFYEPRLGHGLPHSPFKAIVAPRPIGWISTIDENGRVNLAPYSFFNAFSESPPIIGFSSYGPRTASGISKRPASLSPISRRKGMPSR